MRHCQHILGTIAPSKSGLSKTRTALTNTFGVLKLLRESCPARYRQDLCCCPGGGGGFEQDARCLSDTAARKPGEDGTESTLGNAAAHHPHPPAHTALTPGPLGEAAVRSGTGGPAERDRRDALPEPSPTHPLPRSLLQLPAIPFTFGGRTSLWSCLNIPRPLI